MACACGAPVRKDRLRHLERLMPPAEFLARALELIFAERRAMGRGVPSLVGAPYPMTVRHAISEGRSVTCFAFSIARAIASGS